MSTKITLAHGDNFHFYQEILDDEFVYLKLEGAQFEATPTAINIPIPLDVWETIRQLAVAEFDLAEMSDGDLARMVESEVDERIARLLETLTDEPAPKGKTSFTAIGGSLVFGFADEPRKQQIAKGLEYYRRERTRQQNIKQRMNSHKIGKPLKGEKKIDEKETDAKKDT